MLVNVLRHTVISDVVLVNKCELSEVGLKRLFDKFLKAMSNGSSHIQIEVKESRSIREVIMPRTEITEPGVRADL